MKIHQILVEYRRDITAQNLGGKLVNRLKSEPTSTMPEELRGPRYLLDLYSDPKLIGRGKKFDFAGALITVTPENIQELTIKLQPRIIELLLQYIESRDPTPNKAYTQWLARSWINTERMRLEDMNRLNTIGLYAEGKRRNVIKPEDRDINRFTTYSQFEDMVLNKYGVEALDPEAAAKAAEAEKGDYDEVYDDAELRVIHPRNTEAACYYGRGTKWCTSGDKNNYFDDYNEQGPIFILLPKNPKYTGEKYQIHLASSQFMDEKDDPVSPKMLKSRYPKFFAQLPKLDPQAQDHIFFADDSLIERLAAQGHRIAEDEAHNLISQWQDDDEYYREYLENEAIIRGYIKDDNQIDWDKVYQDDDLANYSEHNEEAFRIIRDLQKLEKWTADDYRDFVLKYDGTIEIDILSKMHAFDDLLAAVYDENVYGGNLISDYFKNRVSTNSSDPYNLYIKTTTRDANGNRVFKWVSVA